MMGARLPAAVLSTLSNSSRKRAAKRRPSDDNIENRMWPLDQKFNQMNYSFVSKADEYIKRHPEEFCA